MKLGTILANIAETNGTTREQLKVEFLEKIEDHQEKLLLMECYKAACLGDKSIRWKGKIVPPETLIKEGFSIEADRCGFKYCFE